VTADSAILIAIQWFMTRLCVFAAVLARIVTFSDLVVVAAEVNKSGVFLQKRNASSDADVKDFFLMTNRVLYKVANTMPFAWSDGWDRNSKRAMAADGQGGVFLMSTGHLYHVTEEHKSGVVWSKGWSVDAMVSDGRHGVFVFSRGHLYHVTPDQKDGGERLSSDWYPVAIAADGANGAYVISRKTLYHIDPNGASRKYSDHAWSSYSGYTCRPVMVSDGKDGLFIKDCHLAATRVPSYRSELWHVRPEMKDGTKWWSGGAVNSMGFQALAADGQGGVFMVDDTSALYHVSGKGNAEKWSDKYALRKSFDWVDQTMMLPDGSGGVMFVGEGDSDDGGVLVHYTQAHKTGLLISRGWSSDNACVTPA